MGKCIYFKTQESREKKEDVYEIKKKAMLQLKKKNGYMLMLFENPKKLMLITSCLVIVIFR